MKIKHWPKAVVAMKDDRSWLLLCLNIFVRCTETSTGTEIYIS